MPAPRSHLFVPGDRPDRFDKAIASAAVPLDGRMIDTPLVERARRIVQRVC